MKNNILCNVRTQEVHKINFKLKTLTQIIPNYDSFVSLDTSYLTAKRYFPHIRMNDFGNILFEVKT